MAVATDFISTNEARLPFVHAAAGAPRIVLRLEGLAALGLALFGYERAGGSWLMFAVLFLTPDLSMLGYLAGRRLGAIAYNTAHSYLGPAALAAYGLIAPSQTAVWLALIWGAHIGFDRAMGYGLKYATAFGDTHLGRVGKRARG
jgi:hypothetical protein